MNRLLFLVAALPLVSSAITDGWTDIGSTRRIAGHGRILWRAPVDAAAFNIVRKDGAEGTVSFHNGSIEIEKTNDQGLIAVVPCERPDCSKTKHRRFRTSVYVECTNAQIFASEVYLSFRSQGGDFGLTPLDRKQWGCGRPRNRMLLNTATGVREIKYAHVESEPAEVPSPALVVAGRQALVRCTDWVVEDFDSAQDMWYAVRRAKRPLADLEPQIAEADFLARLKTEQEHTGRVVRKGRRVVVEVDGAEVPPVFYKTMTRDVNNKGRNIFGGMRMLKEAGVGIHVISMRFGRNGRYPSACWSKEGFDVKAGVREVCDLMRLTPDAKFVLSLGLDPYAEYGCSDELVAWTVRANSEGRCRPTNSTGFRFRPVAGEMN